MTGGSRGRRRCTPVFAVILDVQKRGTAASGAQDIAKTQRQESASV